MLVKPNITALHAVPNGPHLPQYQLEAGVEIDVHEGLGTWLVENGKAELVEATTEEPVVEEKTKGKK